ncbi:MAG: hypothetical protein MSR29_07235 [Lachnospiraceae bacterium]|nr:hypothetical protein [Lachnospiraceae bacterium]
MTDKKWLETVDRIMPCIEELLKVSEEFDIRLSIVAGGDCVKAMVDYCKRDSIDTVHELNIYNEGYAEVRNVQSRMVLKKIDMKSPDHCLAAGSGHNK